MLSTQKLSTRAISAERSQGQSTTIPARRNALTLFKGVQAFDIPQSP
jgi:hypothetical protein